VTRTALYNAILLPYNAFIMSKSSAPTDYVMRVSRNGQVSIPAATRLRWDVDEVLVVDLGDRIVVRPLPADRIDSLRGKYRGRGPSTDEARAAEREAEAAGRRR